MNKKISIILTTYNEVTVIEETLNLIYDTLPGVEVVIVDDNSNDGTMEKINKFQNKNIKIYSRKKRGLASAFLLGLINTSGDVVGWIDSNMGNIIKKFPKMINDLNDYDIVVLSRYVDGGSDQRSALRILSSKMLNYICRLYLGKKIYDYSSGIFVMKRTSLLNVLPIAHGHGEFFIEFIFNAVKSGLKIKEVPYIQPPDVEGLSKTASSLIIFLKLGIKYLIRVFLIRFKKF
jgi:glycosyltransferase involved in cell wall biosynthesis